MVWVNTAFNNFVGGEVSPDMYGRYDLAVYSRASEAMQNFIPKTQGPATFRTGFKFTNTTRNNNYAVLKEFIFNNDQAYILEFTDQKLRFFRNNTPIIETAKTITAVTTGASSITITSTAHGYVDGEEVFLYLIVGPNVLNGRSYIVSDSATNTFKLKDKDGDYIDGTGLDAYVSGGEAQRVYEISSPYEESEDLNLIQVAQNADAMYIVHPSYRPYLLTRAGDTNWDLDFVSEIGSGSGTETGTNFPFVTVGNYPRAVGFAQGRLFYGGTSNAVDKFWGSRGPENDGTTRYDDFTTGVSDDHSIAYILAPVGGKVEAIQWISSNDRYFLLGTYGGVSKVTGSRDDEAITATSINVRTLTSYGCFPYPAVPQGATTFFIERSGLILRDLAYDLAQDSYVPRDRNIASTRVTGNGIDQIRFANGRPDVLWARRQDGVLLGVTFDSQENVAGWHRQPLGGDGELESIGVIPRAGKDDQVWLSVKRIINGQTRRYIEHYIDPIIFPNTLDFFTGKDNKKEDFNRYGNVVFDKQREYKHLDSHLTFNGSDFGSDAIKNATLSFGTITDTVEITSNVSIFESTDVGREIWGGYDDGGIGGGRFEITSVDSSTVVTCDVLSEPDIEDDLTPGNWYFTADTITGLQHLEGETVQIVADGGIHPDRTVVDGSITLEAQHSVVHIGYKYRGVIKSLNVVAGGTNGNAQAKRRRVTDIKTKFLETLGASVGTDIYNMEPVLYASTDQKTGRPPQPFTGIKDVPVGDEWVGDRPDDIETHVLVIQDDPLPCTIEVIDIYMETVND